MHQIFCMRKKIKNIQFELILSIQNHIFLQKYQKNHYFQRYFGCFCCYFAQNSKKNLIFSILHIIIQIQCRIAPIYPKLKF